MTNAYDKELISLADTIAAEKNIRLMHGVYVGVTGPTFETPPNMNTTASSAATALACRPYLK